MSARALGGVVLDCSAFFHRFCGLQTSKIKGKVMPSSPPEVWTATIPFSILPRCPIYGRATESVVWPFCFSPVSSIQRIKARSLTTDLINASRFLRSVVTSHGDWVKKWWNDCASSPPTARAIAGKVLLGSAAIIPR